MCGYIQKTEGFALDSNQRFNYNQPLGIQELSCTKILFFSLQPLFNSASMRLKESCLYKENLFFIV